MSNDKIDVLAVLDVACKLHKEGAYADAWEVDLARIYDVRAAVAELMEAAKAGYVMKTADGQNGRYMTAPEHERLLAALDRVAANA